MQHSFLFLSANTPWVYALAEQVAHRQPVHAVRLFDWRTYLKGGRPTWPATSPEAQLRRTMRVMPPGYAGQFEWLFRPFMTNMVARWQATLKQQTGSAPWVIVPYPYLIPWLEGVPEGRVIYYNLDAYTLYRPKRARRIQENERALVERAACTLCLSRYQVSRLQECYPEQASRIRHFPLGVVPTNINPQPGKPPLPHTIGYIGNLTDRVDWRLVEAVARRLPKTRFVFIGSLDAIETGGTRRGWKQERSRALRLPNVDHLGRVPQSEVKRYYWSFAVNWIPYDADHPFNKASCPTKVMDTIAAGRPVVSTDVPECRLYPEWIQVVDGPEAAADVLDRQLQNTHSGEAQVRFARQHTWAQRAQTLLNTLSSAATVESTYL